MEGEWQEIKFPENPDIVYVIYAEKNGTRKPIYVGSSRRNIGRFGDYVSMRFSASTDFKVGLAIRYLESNGFIVVIRYKASGERRSEERKLLEESESKFNLLNQLSGYDYESADRGEEESKIKEYVDKKIISQWK